MKSLTQHITEKLVLNNDTKIRKREYNFHPKTRKELKELIYKLIEERGNEANLNDVDISEITDISVLFDYSEFNGDVSEWDVSNVEDMKYVFAHSKFNGDLSKWDVGNVKNMEGMFYDSEFTGKNGDISKWNVSKVNNMKGMFFDASKFNEDISKWVVNKVTDMRFIFHGCQIKEEYKPKFK